jgi:hypothetical protein
MQYEKLREKEDSEDEQDIELNRIVNFSMDSEG